MELIIRARDRGAPGSARVEAVERKGLGHPDSICDGLAEHVCVRLCRHYLDRFGVVLHHNVDKALLAPSRGLRERRGRPGPWIQVRGSGRIRVEARKSIALLPQLEPD